MEKTKKSIKNKKNVKKKAVKSKIAVKKTKTKSMKKKTVAKKKPVKKAAVKKNDDIKKEKKSINISKKSNLDIKKQRQEVLKNKEIARYLQEKGGEYAPIIIENLITPKTADELAREFNFKLSWCRACLNRLYNLRLTQYSKIRDSETGKYEYKWFVRDEYLKKMVEEFEKDKDIVV
ncbi:hypothetical protein KO465_03645 [Candidatus Micrarchaeota archaeon]|nr:hypothetical protein [Candidatus Micrarchaeota archaeon]